MGGGIWEQTNRGGVNFEMTAGKDKPLPGRAEGCVSGNLYGWKARRPTFGARLSTPDYPSYIS